MSVTMLFFMVFTAHNGFFRLEHAVAGHARLLGRSCWWSGRSSRARPSGLIGGIDSAFNKLAFDKHKNTIWGGFGLLALVYLVGWELLLKP